MNLKSKFRHWLDEEEVGRAFQSMEQPHAKAQRPERRQLALGEQLVMYHMWSLTRLVRLEEQVSGMLRLVFILGSEGASGIWRSDVGRLASFQNLSSCRWSCFGRARLESERPIERLKKLVLPLAPEKVDLSNPSQHPTLWT